MATKKAPSKTTKRTVPGTTMDDVRLTQNRRNSVDSATARSDKARAVALKEKFADINDEKFATSLAKTGVELNKLLGGVNDHLRSSLEELEQVNDLINIKHIELEELRGKDVVSTDLDILISDFDQKERELTGQISLHKESWQKEAMAHTAGILERNKLIETERKREVDEYNYNLKISRREDNDNWESEKKSKKIQLQDEEQALLKGWNLKSIALDERERIVLESEDTINNMDATISSEVEKAVATAKKQVYAETSSKHKMEMVESKHNLDLVNSINSSLNDKLAERDSEIARLRQENTEMSAEVSKMATSALEASSGRFALEQIQKSSEKASSNGKTRS